jgi:hypothetical protein
MPGEEKTALEIILELPSILKKIENKIDVLDTNLKILNGKLNKIKIQEALLPQKNETQKTEQIQDNDNVSTEVIQRPMATPGPIPSENKSVAAPKQSNKLVLGSIKVFSNIKTASGKPVDGMTINIFDDGNDLIRNLLTDKDGYWECKLPPGQYSVEMIHPKLKTINKEFKISKDMKIYEVV